MGKNPHPPRKGGEVKGKNYPKQDDGLNIVFSNAPDKAKRTPAEDFKSQPIAGPSKSTGVDAGNKSQKTGPPAASEGDVKKPDTRTLIGGASWTGKLPMSLLSEHCQKQKWDKPEYTMARTPEGYSSTVLLRSKDIKTKDAISLPPIRMPPSHKILGIQNSAIEARHFAATWAMFRVSSMKNIHMMLPPTYRDLWKGPFQEIKSNDLQAGKDGLYAADPFQALKDHEDQLVQRAKKAEQREKAKQTKGDELESGAILSDRRDLLRGWKTAPKVELGKRTRREVEALIKTQVVWNPNALTLSAKDAKSISDELTKLGFRQSHINEGIEICKDREEVLEWLLIHVPEDDLPKWSLPEGYSAGISLASGNIKREAAIERLAAGGYASDLCQEILADAEGEEHLAAQMLQDMLVCEPSPRIIHSSSGVAWTEEQTILESIYGGRYKRMNDGSCMIEIDGVGNKTLNIHFMPPLGSEYPATSPIVLVTGSIPAYVRLSITRQLIVHTTASLLGEPMIFNMIDWLENEAPRILDDPGSLTDISAVSNAGLIPASAMTQRRPQPSSKRKVLTLTSTPNSPVSQRMLSEWKTRQNTSQQRKMTADRQALPAWSKQEAIVSAVDSHQVVIISGETGSGKSTQAVQFILDDMIGTLRGETARFICTQPRRISALGLADRVSSERCGRVGAEVGYSIRGESKTSADTRITFCTTGVLLRRLQTSGGTIDDIIASVADVSHVFVDEVHERSLDTDFLLALLRDMMKKRKNLKVILMSATLDAKVFEDYFGGPRNVAKVEIEGRTHPVDDLYLDDALRMTGYNARLLGEDEGAAVNDEISSVSKGIQSLGIGINYDFIAHLIRRIDAELGSQPGGILIFLPGTLEINRTLEALRTIPGFHALPLHASLLPNEQRQVFPAAPPGKRKVIASTNVAETSITIPDIVAVVDTGRVKETRYDPQSSTVKLTEVWASRAACKQRRGRAGRVQAGKCYKLFTRAAAAKMADRPEPEIRRLPLEQLAHSVKAMGVKDVQAFLQGTLTPPEDLAVEGALKLLSRMGALDGDELTALGHHMAMVPADLRCAKLIIQGALFGCLEASVTIASVFTVKSPFVSPQGKRDEADAARLAFGPNLGDPVVSLRAYDLWSTMRSQSSFREVRAWCEQNFLSWHTLNDIASTRSQYLSSLKEIGFLPLSYTAATSSSDSLNRNAASLPLLQALLLSALHPNTLRILYPPQKYTATAAGTLPVDPEAKSIKLFTEQNTRAFIHPSSTLFSSQSFPSSLGGGGVAGFLSYWSKVETSKVMVREVAPVGTFGVLLFAGTGVEVDGLGRGLVVDEWIRVRGWARIGVLVSRLRGVLDQVLRGWVESPGQTGGGGGVVELVRKLVELDGLDS